MVAGGQAQAGLESGGADGGDVKDCPVSPLTRRVAFRTVPDRRARDWCWGRPANAAWEMKDSAPSRGGQGPS